MSVDLDRLRVQEAPDDKMQIIGEVPVNGSGGEDDDAFVTQLRETLGPLEQEREALTLKKSEHQQAIAAIDSRVRTIDAIFTAAGFRGTRKRQARPAPVRAQRQVQEPGRSNGGGAASTVEPSAVLEVIRAEGGEWTQGDIARRFRISPSASNRIVSKLRKDGSIKKASKYRNGWKYTAA